jgi:hyperosmotically inducible periplasmic protein
MVSAFTRPIFEERFSNMKHAQKRVVIGIVAAWLGAAVLAGCSTWGDRADGRSTGQVADDDRVTSEVKSGLANEPVFKFNDVDVKTFNGVVQLSGFVNTEDQKQRAGQIAQQTERVARVVNNITLKTMPTGRSTGTAPIVTQTNTAPQAPAQP